MTKELIDEILESIGLERLEDEHQQHKRENNDE